ncbi:MAG TPA: histidine kinase [Pseudonocardiaceae bacterium]|jgi:signal transduction histidine kinase|nr:histidine kinase [Pseudonocardiaceae bacterium]
MKIPGWVPNRIQVPSSVKRNALLLPALFLLNSFFFAAWQQLSQVATKPWLIFVWLYGLAMLVPLLWRDRAPLTVFSIQWVLTVAAWPFMPYYTPVVGIPVALYAVSAHHSKKNSLLALLASFIPIGLGAAVAFRIYTDPSSQLHSFIPNAILLVIVTIGAWGAGRVTRTSQQHVQKLERERETVREAVTAERSRIARELHDIVSHAVTAIVLQAAGASRVANTNFAQVTQSLANIETTGKQAMTELRRLLGVLEASEPIDDDAEDIDDLGPQPGLADMTALLASLRDTGMPVTVHVEGTPRHLDQSIDLAAYRIVQEGLTNVLKHGGMDSHPQLRLIWEARSLIIQIDNDINIAAAHRGQALSVGRGLIGLRARAHAAGGRLHAGPHHHGGYRLTAALPLADTPQRILLDHHQ